MPAIGAISFVESAECQEQFYYVVIAQWELCDVVIGRDCRARGVFVFVGGGV